MTQFAEDLLLPQAARPRDLRLAVVGTGALGSTLLQHLLQRKTRSVLLVDPETVEARNLPLSPLLQDSFADWLRHQPGSPLPNKAELLARAAQAQAGLPWRAIPRPIADVGWQDLSDIDLFCCCTDSVLSRAETAWIARSLSKPLLDAGVLGDGIPSGRVTLYPPTTSAACVLCGLAEQRRAEVLGYAASTSIGCQVPESVPAMTASLDTLQQVAAATATQIEVFASAPNLPATIAASSMRLSQSPGERWEAESFELARSLTCPWHEPPTATLRSLPWELPLAQALPGADWQLFLHWPVCTEASCSGCGTRTRPMQRVAQVRASACPACGTRRQQPLRAVHRICAQDTWAKFSPRQLGMPDRHLYWVRISALYRSNPEAAT
ncbi:ThiF family adenylyltransferase [Terriglobus aquaticus]|uniref:ThiF family adenylyltransferase n=1 Tax=Terriglobus aquaticus TaxID=940139 RepID=A0ABW9KHF0_9BACT|nr:ThiF family adenylyltransferase [Terriglobus aquaticus]